MPKRYKIEKIVFAESIAEADTLVSGGETAYIQLMDDIKEPTDVGFTKTYDKMVQPIQKRSRGNESSYQV